jgi:hypothetical protein
MAKKYGDVKKGDTVQFLFNGKTEVGIIRHVWRADNTYYASIECDNSAKRKQKRVAECLKMEEVRHG